MNNNTPNYTDIGVFTQHGYSSVFSSQAIQQLKKVTMTILLPCGWQPLLRVPWIPTPVTYLRYASSHNMHHNNWQLILVREYLQNVNHSTPFYNILSLLAYLCNVLAALGQSASSTLSQMEVLFKAEEEE